MKINVIVKSGENDSFKTEEDSNSKNLIIPAFELTADNNIVQNDVLRILRAKELSPTITAMELFNLFYAVYGADQLISRSSFGYFSWSRHIVIHLAVHDVEKWEKRHQDFIRMFSFLSGDRWDIKFRQKDTLDLKDEKNPKSKDVDVVSLFSGGLDSLTGVIDILESKKKVAVVGHHKGGGTQEKGTQLNLFGKLQSHYKDQMHPYFFNVLAMKKHNKLGGENTQRARSILFLGLGILVSNCLGDLPLYVPENGLISLNVPLTNARLSSFSTRTTHPHFLSMLQKILNYFHLDIEIINPFQLQTKGELLKNCSNFELLKSLYQESVSCSKPYYYRRYNKINKAHCGHCTPCLIRRASLNKVDLDDPADYVYDVLKNPFPNRSASGRDTRAFKIGIAKTLKNKDYLEFRLLKSGYIPGGRDSISNYTNVLLRGIEEVNSLFNKD